METSKIIKQAKILNWFEIGITIVLYILFRILNSAAKNATTQDALNRLTAIQSIGLLVVGACAVVVIVLTAILMKKNQKKVQGLGFLLAASICTLVFSIIGMMLGLVVWILCGISIQKLSQKKAEDNFEAQLQNEVNTNAYDPNYSGTVYDPNYSNNANNVYNQTPSDTPQM